MQGREAFDNETVQSSEGAKKTCSYFFGADRFGHSIVDFKDDALGAIVAVLRESGQSKRFR